MPIPLGVLAVAGAGAAGAGAAYEQLESVILTGTQATVSFSNLNSTYGSTYQHLQIRAAMRTNRASQPVDTVIYNFNSNTSGYASHYLTGNGSSVASSSDINETRGILGVYTAASTTTANIFTAFVMDILDPFETTKNTTTRTLIGLAGSGTNGIQLISGLWNNTAAVTSITFDAIGDFIAGTRFSLYGLRSA